MKNKKTVRRYLCTFTHKMVILRIVTNLSHFFACTIAILFTTMPIQIAKSNPTMPAARLLAFKRAKSLDNGVSVSWLEQTWNKDALTQNNLSAADLSLLKQLGFKSIRLPVAFEYYEDEHIADEQLYSQIDNVLKRCQLYGMKVILDYHNGDFNEKNFRTATKRAINTWLKLVKRYKRVSDDELFFEIYNEPPHMDPQIWKDATYNIVTVIRQNDAGRTLIIGASNYNSIYELSRFVPLSDENIIYTFHFYEPFSYNAEKFPILNPKAKNTDGEKNYNEYSIDGNEQSVRDKLQIVKDWGNKYDVPLLCGEYGVYNKYADLDSRCRYIKTVKQALKALQIPGMLWDYNGSFSIFEGKPSMADLPACMKEAIVGQ
jgi:endoglucanase